jgi:hypothetical protein
VTVKLFVPTLPCASVAVQVTIVTPSANVAPLAGVQIAASDPSMLSVADAANVYATPAGPVASTLALAGTATTGAVTSIKLTVTVKLPVTRLPALSLAEHSTVVVPIGKRVPVSGVQTTDRTFST